MKKAVISTGGKQYLVSEGDEIDVEIMKSDKKDAEFEPLLVIDGQSTVIGTPFIDKGKVVASILQQEIVEDKVTSIRYKPKKRVRKIHGHRQRKTKIKIKSIKV